MNFFELYTIPVSFNPDPETVKKQFYLLSRKFHPDFFGGADEAEKQHVLEMSALVNKAYKTFQSADAVMKYLLQIHSLLEEEEKYALPPQFLMEVMELNEQVMEMDKEDQAAKALVLELANELQKDIYEPVEAIIKNYQKGITTEKELLQVKEYYYKKKYLNRILAEIS
jgi:molecular chaperone HscB